MPSSASLLAYGYVPKGLCTPIPQPQPPGDSRLSQGGPGTTLILCWQENALSGLVIGPRDSCYLGATVNHSLFDENIKVISVSMEIVLTNYKMI